MLNFISPVFVVLLAILISACAQKEIKNSQTQSEIANNQINETLPTDELIAKLINNSRIEKFSTTAAIDVYYATNRDYNQNEAPCSNSSYSVKISNETHYGVCRINVPKIHDTGKIEFSNDFSSDSNKFFKVINHKKFDFDNFQKTVQNSSNSEVLIFVHGFNVKFQDAVLRASQLAYDLKFQGHIVLFSWPAGASESLLSNTLLTNTYQNNRANAKNSVQSAIDFFDMFSRIGLKVNIYVHSMGHQVVIPALVELSKNTEIKLLVHELILNAPDYDLKEFVELAPNLLKLASRITLYCSYNDSAMLASKTVNGGVRLGACEAIPGIDVINVSEIDNPTFGTGLGHSYYSSRAVLADVAQLIMGIEAEKRLFIRKSEPRAKENFFLRP